MRLKTFAAKSVQEAMDMVRAEMGEDAIIVNIDQGKRIGGARITAAVERGREPQPKRDGVSVVSSPKEEATAAPSAENVKAFHAQGHPFDMAELKAILSHHGIPFDLSERIAATADAMESASLNEALAGALENCFSFAAIPATNVRPLVLVGPPGAGKTVTVAKLAAEALLNERKVRLISSDTSRAAGIEQLESFAKLMKLPVSRADDLNALKAAVAPKSGQARPDITLIDTQGINPFEGPDRDALRILIEATDGIPLLVLPAGIDPLEAADMAGVFGQLGARALITTRMDVARRFASVLTAARKARLDIAAISRTPFVAQGLETATPLSLARMMSDLTRLQPGQVKPSSGRAAGLRNVE